MKKTTEEILGGLAGLDELYVGKKYYIFTVTYQYIGRIKTITDKVMVLEDADIVMNAGNDNDAVSKIVNGKVKPQVYETPGKPILVFRQAITACIPM